MTVSVSMENKETGEKFDTGPTNQVETILWWESREIWYNISYVTITHNPEYPTPAVTVIQPQPGIKFNVYNLDGELVYTNKKSKDQ